MHGLERGSVHEPVVQAFAADTKRLLARLARAGAVSVDRDREAKYETPNCRRWWSRCFAVSRLQCFPVILPIDALSGHSADNGRAAMRSIKERHVAFSALKSYVETVYMSGRVRAPRPQGMLMTAHRNNAFGTGRGLSCGVYSPTASRIDTLTCQSIWSMLIFPHCR